MKAIILRLFMFAINWFLCLMSKCATLVHLKNLLWEKILILLKILEHYLELNGVEIH